MQTPSLSVKTAPVPAESVPGQSGTDSGRLPPNQLITQPDTSGITLGDVKEYRSGVEALMSLNSSTVISNGKSVHAAILFEKFFEHAVRKVRIFCQDLNPDVFDRDEVVENARKAMDRGVEISVVMQTEPRHSRFLELLRQRQDSATLRLAGESAGKADSNFAVMDSQAVRVEPNRKVLAARAVMYNPEYAGKLVETFDKVFKGARPYSDVCGDVPALTY